MADIVEIIIRCFVTFLILLLLAHWIGKEMIGQMTYLHYMSAITLGSIAGNMVFNTKIKFVDFLVSIVLFGVITWVLAVISFRHRRTRKWIEGQPTVIIKNGRVLEDEMKIFSYTIDLLNQGLRKKDIFDINEVEFAVLEADGSLSVLKKPEYLPAAKSDLNSVKPKQTQYPAELVMEGLILEDNLKDAEVTKEWLKNEIGKKGLALEDIFYAVKGTKGQLYFDLYEHKRQ